MIEITYTANVEIANSVLDNNDDDLDKMTEKTCEQWIKRDLEVDDAHVKNLKLFVREIPDTEIENG